MSCAVADSGRPHRIGVDDDRQKSVDGKAVDTQHVVKIASPCGLQ